MATRKTPFDQYVEKRTLASEEAIEEYRSAASEIEHVDALIRALNDECERQNVSKAALARRANMSAAYVRRLLGSEEQRPGVDTLNRLGKPLGLNLNWTKISA